MAWDQVQRLLHDSFAAGLVQKVEPPLGQLLADAVHYCHRDWLDRDHLKKIVATDNGAALTAVLSNSVTGATMKLIRDSMIGCALLGDRDGVVRWAKEGTTRCTKVGGDWGKTAKDWEWVTENTQKYCEYVRELKIFQNQLE